MTTSTLATIEHDTLHALYTWGWEVRFNDLEGAIQCKPGPHAEWENVTEHFMCHFRNEMRKEGITYVNAAWDAVVSQARKNRYHPIREYLYKLTYDGGKYIQVLANCFDNPDGMFDVFIRRWLIGAVRRAIKGTQNRMLVIDGLQDIGKSKFVEWLVPEHLRAAHFVSSAIDPSNDDHQRRLLNTWVWEVGEVGATTRRADMEALKHFLTLEQVTVRKKYDRGDTVRPNLTNFIGTFNNISGVLNDPTGSRRFMFCKVVGIDWRQYTTTLTQEQIWAEAYAAYLAGESADLTGDEANKAKDINDGYYVESPVKDLLLHYFKIDPNDTSNFIWTSDIEYILQNPPLLQQPNGATVQDRTYKGSPDKLRKEISEILYHMGCKKDQRRKPGNSSPQKGFWGVIKK